MRINDLTIKNFRCYYGENTISFNSDGKITLIYGDSGYGKSSMLQFFKWMFYDNPDFGAKDDKPIFNLCTFQESNIDDLLEVSGIINFEHLDKKYSLIKKLIFKVGLKAQNTLITNRETKLSILENDNWVPFNGDIANKINSIMPIGLSNYFLLDGERARDIVLDSKNLKKAIYSLFEIDAYDKAISHLGSDHKKRSVIGQLSNIMASKMTTKVNNMTATELGDTLTNLYDNIEILKEERKNIIEQINIKSSRKDELLKILGELSNKSNLQEIIQLQNKRISDYQTRIRVNINKIGDLFYNNYPYLILQRIASNNSKILRDKNNLMNSSNTKVFENLQKSLLKEIQDNSMCICGRTLDEHSINHIKNLLEIMPPNSYTYEFNKFVSKLKNKIQEANINIYNYGELLNRISSYENEITKSYDVIAEKEESLKRLSEAKNLVEEHEQLKCEIDSLNNKKSSLDRDIAKKRLTYDISNRTYKDLVKNDSVSKEYGGKIKFFETCNTMLIKQKEENENNVKTVLNSCVRDVFKQLSTQKDIDVDKIQFINNDYSLRTTYLSGGQLAVDEYSYIIGLIKALQTCKIDNNENPIIIDAPFAFTGNEQSEHIFKTLPKIVKQSILLTLDLNKIKKLLNDDSLYEFYIIKNESQSKAKIERGNINDIKF